MSSQSGISTLELHEQAYRLQELTHNWIQNPQYSEYQPLFTTQDEWTMVKYVMEVLRRFRYWTLWMLKKHTVALDRIIPFYNDMFDYMDGVLLAETKQKTQWKADMLIAVKYVRQKLSTFYAKVTATMGTLLMSAHILNLFRKLRSFRKWDKGMDINAAEETSYTAQYHEAFLKYVENEYCAKRRWFPVI